MFSNQHIIKLYNIKLNDKKLLKCKLEYIDKNNKDAEKNIRIYETKSSMSLLNSNDINQYFTDCAYKCISIDLDNVKALLVLLGYNFNQAKFQLILIAFLSSEGSYIL